MITGLGAGVTGTICASFIPPMTGKRVVCHPQQKQEDYRRPQHQQQDTFQKRRF
jgi:hypothetical protein